MTTSFRHASWPDRPNPVPVDVASATCAEAVGWSGLDFVVVDIEHVPLELSEVIDVHRALSATPAGTITRRPWNDAVVVRRVLEDAVLSGQWLFLSVQGGTRGRPKPTRAASADGGLR